MLNEFKILLTIQKFLLENYNIDNNNSLIIAQEILKIFNKYNLELPDSTNIKKIEVENDKIFKVFYKDNKVENLKIGKLLLKLFPHLSEQPKLLQKIVDEIKQEIIKNSSELIINRYNFKTIKNNISKYYEKFERIGLGSCMTKVSSPEEILKFYDINPDIELLIIEDKEKNNKIVGRALMWHKINGNKTFVDEFYGDVSYYELLKTFCKKNRYILKSSNDSDKFYDFSSSLEEELKTMNLKYKIPDNVAKKNKLYALLRYLMLLFKRLYIIKYTRQ